MKQHRQRPLAVGDFCTTKSKYPENAGLRVIVTAHVPGRRANDGKLVQFSIQRLDGEPLPLTQSSYGRIRRNVCKIAMIGRSRLVRLDLDGDDYRDKLVVPLTDDLMQPVSVPCQQPTPSLRAFRMHI